jgi:DNA topoisomerase-2
MVEPKFYVPILPLVLINGADGIGTGWSTNIPSYNPREIANMMKDKLENSDA